MSYTKHNFQVGDRLTSQAMNEMDTQIAANEASNIAQQAVLDNMDSYIANKLQGLTLSVDSDRLYLMNGSTLLSSVSLPLDLDNYIPCTGVSIDAGSGATELFIGQSATFSATAQPSDTTQNKRWSVSDISKASITSAGLLTALDIGTITVLVQCGRYNASASLEIKKKVDFANDLSYPAWLGSYDSTQHQLSISTSANGAEEKLVALYPYNLTKYTLNPGETFTITFINNNFGNRLQNVIFFKSLDGQEIVLEDKLEDNNVYRIKNIEEIAESGFIHDKTQNPDTSQWGYWGSPTYSYTNNTNNILYYIMAFFDNDSVWYTSADPQANARTAIGQNVEIVISKATSSS